MNIGGIFFLLLLCIIAQTYTQTTVNYYEQTRLTHLTLIQFYRWFQVYERPYTVERINNSLDILEDNVTIESSNGVMNGKDNYPNRLLTYRGWHNAHHIEILKDIEILPNSKIKLEADVLYQNILPTGIGNSYVNHYIMTLDLRPNDLPLLSYVKITPIREVEPIIFKNAYPTNRVKSFMHNWLYNIERARDPNDFLELLANNFELHLTSNQSVVDTWIKFEEWIQSIPVRIKLSSHHYKDFTVKEYDNGTLFNVTVKFDWQGVTTDTEQTMIAETSHQWILENNLDERFARLKYMKVEEIRPFQLLTNDASINLRLWSIILLNLLLTQFL